MKSANARSFGERWRLVGHSSEKMPRSNTRSDNTGISRPSAMASEDAVRLPGSRWAIVSAMRSKGRDGALRVVDLRRPARPASALPVRGLDPHLFAPHGLGVRPIGRHRFELLVVDHGDGEAIDRVTIETGRRPRTVALSRIVMPRGTSGNGVAPLSDGGFVVTSTFDPDDASTLSRFASARPTGRLWRWSATSGWHAFGPQLSGANGVAVADGGRTIYAAEWAARRVWRMSIGVTEAASVPLSFLPDNLRIDGGELRVAGQMARPEQVYACEERAIRCTMGYATARLDMPTMRIRTSRRVDDDEARRQSFGGVTGYFRTDNLSWMTSFTGKRLAYCK